MQSGARQRHQLIAPGEREFREAVQQYHTGLTGRVKAGFKDMHDYAVVGVDASRTHAWRQDSAPILDAVIVISARVHPLSVQSQGSVGGKKAQCLQDISSRNVALDHNDWSRLHMRLRYLSFRLISNNCD